MSASVKVLLIAEKNKDMDDSWKTGGFNLMGKCCRKLVKGFLHTRGRSIVNEDGDEIILTGWGLGNWLLSEGYMWLSGPGKRFDRPRHIEAVIRELTGSAYAESFWGRYRENYVTREDICYMAELGYNSVRIPINWRVLMEDEPGFIWKEDGFTLLDQCLDWCEEFGIYAFLDLHGAPGGQSGSNIDDSIDDFPRMFTDRDSWDKCIELWKKIAGRYCNRWIVGGYDLLNEPICPGFTEDKNTNYLLPKLVQFYEEVIAEIRSIDQKHLLSIEGHHWATDTAVFCKKYDENMVIHFHRYACMPGMESLRDYLNTSERWNMPLWLGETGENYSEWYTAMYPLAVSLGIGYNLWPWKKMSCSNSPCSINKPEGWDRIIDYTHGGQRPGYKEAQTVFDSFLENMKLQNCEVHPEVTHAVFRQPGCRVRGTDFNILPGKGISFSGLRCEGNTYNYHVESGMCIRAILDEPMNRRFAFDCGWDLLTLEMEEGEFAAYSIHEVTEGCSVSIELLCCKDASVSILQDKREIACIQLSGNGNRVKTSALLLEPAGQSVVKVCVNRGKINLNVLCFDK